MFDFLKSAAPVAHDYNSCSGCSLCLLVCPVWRATRDLRMSPHGRAKALQNGASIEQIATSVEACTLCGACEPVCPERINLVEMVIELRTKLPRLPAVLELQTCVDAATVRAPAPRPSKAIALLPDNALRAHDATLQRVRALLNCAIAEDDGIDISLALEAGAAVAPQRWERLMTPLRGLKSIVVADGLLAYHLKSRLKTVNVVSLGQALTSLTEIRSRLTAGDLYVIEPRAYHADHDRLAVHYDGLRNETGCLMNLDLLRIAIPATTRSLQQSVGLQPADHSAHVHRLLHGRRITRVVVENIDDMHAFPGVIDCPTIHIADVAHAT
jgi:ferredoxin